MEEEGKASVEGGWSARSGEVNGSVGSGGMTRGTLCGRPPPRDSCSVVFVIHGSDAPGLKSVLRLDTMCSCKHGIYRS